MPSYPTITVTEGVTDPQIQLAILAELCEINARAAGVDPEEITLVRGNPAMLRKLTNEHERKRLIDVMAWRLRVAKQKSGVKNPEVTEQEITAAITAKLAQVTAKAGA